MEQKKLYGCKHQMHDRDLFSVSAESLVNSQKREPGPSILLVHNFGITEKCAIVSFIETKAGRDFFRTTFLWIRTIWPKEGGFDPLKKETMILKR